MTSVRRIREELVEEPREELGITEAQILALLQTALNIMGARLLLLIGLGGGIALTYFAMQSDNAFALIAQFVFGLAFFAPMVWLSARRAI